MLQRRKLRGREENEDLLQFSVSVTTGLAAASMTHKLRKLHSMVLGEGLGSAMAERLWTKGR